MRSPLAVRPLALAASSALAGGLLALHPGAASAATTVVVHSGQSIQAAIDAAAPGTTILVKPGTYAENLNIPKDGITLSGDGETADVRLVPPATVAPVCGETSSGVMGICVADVVGMGPNGPITKTVHDVHIHNLTIRNFTDSGIFVIDGSGVRIDDVRSFNNGGYGVFALRSTGTRITDNVAADNQEAGFYVGESPQADAVIANNDSHRNGFGIFVRDSRHVSVHDNTANGNCAGLVFVNTGGGSGVGNATASRNTTDRNNVACPAQGTDSSGTSGIGVAIVGGDHIVLQGGHSDGNHATGSTPGSGGILMVPGGAMGGTNTTNITVRDYHATGNDTDIVEAVPDATNQFTDVECSTSSPGGLCDS